MNLRPVESLAAFGAGSPAAASAGRALGGLGAFSQAAYRQSDQIRRSIVLPGCAPAQAQGGTLLAGALAGFVASPAGHDALARLAGIGSSLLEKTFGLVSSAEQLALPLA